MRTTNDGRPVDREPASWVVWLAHHSVTMIAIWAALVLVEVIWRTVLGPPPLLLTAVGLMAVVPLILGDRAARRHAEAVPCDWCHQRTPLDPAAAVARHRIKLWVWHKITERRGRSVLVGALLLAGVAPLFILRLTGPAAIVIAVLFTGTVVARDVIGKWHNRLSPWCPWCRDDDLNDHVVEPTPDPDPVVEPTPDPVTITLR